MVKKMKHELWNNGNHLSLKIWKYPLAAEDFIIEQLLEAIEATRQDVKDMYT